MEKKPRKKKRDSDFAVTAFRVVQEATEQIESEPEKAEPELAEGKNPHAVALGRLGGLKGGKARFERLTSEQRKEIARKAAQARWASQATEVRGSIAPTSSVSHPARRRTPHSHDGAEKWESGRRAHRQCIRTCAPNSQSYSIAVGGRSWRLLQESMVRGLGHGRPP